MASPSVYELSSKNGSDAVLSAANGTFVLNTTTTYSGNVKAVVLLEDTIINSLKHVGDVAEQKTAYIGNSAIALKAGTIITPANQNIFDTVKLTSGSAILVL